MTSVYSSVLHLTEEVALPRALVDAHREGNLVIFVGAGASMDPPANLPSFKKLACDLACLAAVPFSESFVDDQGCSRTQEPRELDRFLGSFPRDFDVRRHALKFVREAQPNATHEAVVRLAEAGGVSRIVTTNYDDLLSIAAEGARINIERWDAPVLPDGGNFAGIVHLHGSVKGDPKGIVLTDEDFGNAYLSNGWATRFLVPMFRHYTVLFIGYSLGDLIMRYLRRGMSDENCCYALVPEANAKSADWGQLGVKPIGYPVQERCDGSQDHGSLVKVLQEWASFAEAGSKEHEKQVSEIVREGPQALGVVDHDYLKMQLADLNGALRFKKACGDIDATRAWGWLKWVDANVPEFRSAFVGERTSDAVDVLVEWYCSCFIADPKLHGAALHIALEHGLTFNDKLFERANVAVRKLSEVDAEAGNRWKALLLSSVRRRGAGERALPIEPYQRGQKVEGLLALAEMMLPRLKRRLDCNLGQNEEIPSTPRCEPTWDVHSEILSEHLSKAVDQRPAADPQLGVVLENALVQCYQLLVSYQGDCGDDPLSVQRSAIEKHEQDESNNQLGAIIDAIRDYGLRAQREGGVDLAERWWSLEGILFRRLAIHLIDESKRSVNDKIAWLLDHVDLHDRGCRHEIYHLLQETVKSADAETRARVLEAACKTTASDEDEDDRAVGVVGNLLHWLVQRDENWKEAYGALEHFQSQHPEFEVSEHPDFWLWTKDVVMSEEEFKERFGQEPKGLQELISNQDDESSTPVRQHKGEFVESVAVRNPQAVSKFLDVLCREAEETSVACCDFMTDVWDCIDQLDKQDRLRFVQLVVSVVSSGELPSEWKTSILVSSVLAGSGSFRVVFAEATRELLERCPDDVKNIWDGWLRDHITQRLDGVPREAMPDEIAAWADIVPFLGDQIGEGLKLFERKDVALYKKEHPYRIPKTVPQEHVDRIVAFYARRIKSTRLIDFPLISQLKAIIDRFEMDLIDRYGKDVGTEAVKLLRDACDKAGIGLRASRS